MKVNCLLFNGFTALDVFGPVEVFGCIDMALGFIQDVHGKGFAENIAKGLEYIWNSDNDPFSV